MHLSRIFIRLLICFFLLFPLTVIQARSGQEIRLADLNPDKTALGVFHSYRHKALLVSLVQTDKSTFKCLPNQYYLYNYGTERYFDISAGNLKINSNYTRIFRTRVHSMSGSQLSTSKEQKQVLKMLSRTLKIPAELISAAHQKSTNPNRICWQQPELLDMQNNRLRSFPFLAANLCQKQWCSDLYWTSPSSIRLWVHNKPKQFQLINLDIQKGTFTVKSSSPRFTRPDVPQLNAPRDNLVNSETLDGKILVLKKNTRVSVRLEWHKEASGRIIVSLIRKGADSKAAEREQQRYRQMITNKAYRGALQSAEFALWLDPQNQTIKLDKAKLFISLALINRFFESLKQDFNNKERFTACQKLHIDPSIRHLWKNEPFVTQFKEICSQ